MTKSVQNVHQGAPNCTISINFLEGGGHAPEPPSNAHGKFPNLGKKILPPTLPNPDYAPGAYCSP